MIRLVPQLGFAQAGPLIQIPSWFWPLAPSPGYRGNTVFDRLISFQFSSPYNMLSLGTWFCSHRVLGTYTLCSPSQPTPPLPLSQKENNSRSNPSEKEAAHSRLITSFMKNPEQPTNFICCFHAC